MPRLRALSKTEFQVLLGTAIAYWFFAWADHIVLSHEWFSLRGFGILCLSLIQPGVVILGTILVASAFQSISMGRQWDATLKLYRIVRFAILFSAVFLSLLAAHAGIPTLIPNWFGWGFGIDYMWTLPFTMLLFGLCALGLVKVYHNRTKFIIACGLIAVGVGGGLGLRYPPMVAQLDAGWYEMLDAMRPWRSINDSIVTIVTMPNWPGGNRFRRLTEAIVKSQPRIVGVLAPVYFHIAEEGDTSFYSSVPTSMAVYGVMSDWYHQENHQADLPVPQSIRKHMDRGIITGIESKNPFSGQYNYGQAYEDLYDWETSFVPILNANDQVPYSEESMDAGLAIVGKYLGISSPMPVTRSWSFWSSGILHAAGRDIPLTHDGKVLINFPTRYTFPGHAYRVERECYQSQFTMSWNSKSNMADDTVISLNWNNEAGVREGYRVPDEWSERQYRLKAGKIVRYDTKYRYIYTMSADTMNVEYIPELRNKIVLITQQRPTVQLVDHDVIGITYASIIQNLLDRDFITPLNRWWVLISLLFTSSIVITTFLRKKALRALGIGVGSLLGCAFLIVALFSWLQVYVSAVPIIVPGFVMLGLLFPCELARERRILLEERAALSSELRTAHEAQMGLMPTSDPVVPGFDISGVCRPAEEVGGDYFDYVWLNEKKTKLGIAIADVSGKAMKAAMTAVMTSGMVYREIGQDQTPKEILREINRPMYFKTDRRIFTAMSFAVIDTRAKTLAFSNAGQMQPLLKRNNKIESLKVEGARLPLGMAQDVKYNELTIRLRSGDVVVFYTDGIPEAMNGREEMFGFDRLEAVVQQSESNRSAKQIVTTIVERVAEFASATKQHDDMTVVAVRAL